MPEGKKKMCPIFNARSHDPAILEFCSREECEWWSRLHGVCSVKLLAQSISEYVARQRFGRKDG